MRNKAKILFNQWDNTFLSNSDIYRSSYKHAAGDKITTTYDCAFRLFTVDNPGVSMDYLLRSAKERDLYVRNMTKLCDELNSYIKEVSNLTFQTINKTPKKSKMKGPKIVRAFSALVKKGKKKDRRISK